MRGGAIPPHFCKLSPMKKLLIISTCCYVLLSTYSIVGSSLITINNNYQLEFKNTPITEIMVLFFVGSVVETLLFNLLPFIILKLTPLKNYDYLIIIIASVFFGIAHFSSIEFAIVTFIAGIIFNFNFYKCLIEKGYICAFFSTFVIHFLSNLTVYIYDINR